MTTSSPRRAVYTRSELEMARRWIRRLRDRVQFLSERIEKTVKTDKSPSYDVAEKRALEWAIDVCEKEATRLWSIQYKRSV